MNHAPRDRAGLANFNIVPHLCEVVGRRQAARSSPDNQDFLSGLRQRPLKLPALLERQVTEKTLDGVNADFTVGMDAIAGAFTRVIANASMDRRQRVVDNELSPGGFKLTGLCQGQPRLDVLPGGACVVAGRKIIDVIRTPRTQRACTSAVARQICALCKVFDSHD